MPANGLNRITADLTGNRENRPIKRTTMDVHPEAALQVWRRNRKNLLQFMNSYDAAQLNRVPDGFSNNLIWNLGHILAVQQLLVYGLSGQPLHIPQKFVVRYQRDTRPEGPVDEAEISEIREWLERTVPLLDKDLEANRFGTFRPFTNSAGFPVTNLQEAITFNNFHEGLHLGYMLSIRKFL
ncbi:MULTISPECIES: DinB family protein [unclassified Robiginitalea]|uniref:DinB family protein n=3 Tax=Flavobacteriaceae TaxID=49546 RepID=UPI00300E4D4C